MGSPHAPYNMTSLHKEGVASDDHGSTIIKAHTILSKLTPWNTKKPYYDLPIVMC